VAAGAPHTTSRSLPRAPIAAIVKMERSSEDDYMRVGVLEGDLRGDVGLICFTRLVSLTVEIIPEVYAMSQALSKDAVSGKTDLAHLSSNGVLVLRIIPSYRPRHSTGIGASGRGLVSLVG